MEEFHDDHQIRYRLAAESKGDFDWLFVPGGPGADSSYYGDLLAHLRLPGRAWLVDLPGNGTNPAPDGHDYDQWLEIFPHVCDRFDHPVLVGHSFGGHVVLLTPELEERLAGLVILNSTPKLWQEESLRYGKQFDLPDLTEEMGAFIANPTQETFDIALAACTPYYFAPEHLAAGREALLQVPFPFEPAVWWQRKALEIDYNATWVPQQVPTLILGSRYDCICPFTLFQQDERFRRGNIELTYIQDAGHLPWVENPDAVHQAFDHLIARLT